MPKINHVVIVGAGPSGLLLAILLARQKIKVTVLDADTKINGNPRAAHYAPSAVYDFIRAGIIDDVRKEGFSPTGGVCWRYQDTTFIAGMGRDAEEDEYSMVVLPLDRLGPLLVRHLESYEGTKILWKHKCVGVEQDDKEARVIVETPEGQKKVGGDYVVGADGATSGVRKALFGNEYPGETLPQQIVATNVYLPFDERFGYWDSNFIVHEKDWYMAAKITTDGLWRVTYGDDAGISAEEIIKRQPLRYEQILPGNPKPGDYKLVSMSPYKLQQRCAPSFRVGKVVLVADAAHLCNPFGGLGLTGGFADVGSLYDCFMGINEDQLDEDILDKYSEIRIKIWREMIDPMSRSNFHRLWDPTMDKDREEFWKMCEKASDDPVWGKSVADSIHSIRHDFTQYYKNKPIALNGAQA